METDREMVSLGVGGEKCSFIKIEGDNFMKCYEIIVVIDDSFVVL